MSFHWGDKLKYKGIECLFLSYASGCKSAYVILQGNTEAIKISINELITI